MASLRSPYRLMGSRGTQHVWLQRVLRSTAVRPFSRSAALSGDISQGLESSYKPQAVAPEDSVDLDSTSHTTPGPSDALVTKFAGRLKRRKLVPSRYHYRSPRYYRGPLHPHQPPPKNSPASREYIPGPFSYPRLMETYQSIVESDLMTLFYQHVPPGTVIPEPAQRLRGWDDSSPYYKNRRLRGPRGHSHLPLKRKIVTFRNVPTMEKITISTLLRQGAKDSAYTHVASMILQAISNKQAKVHLAKRASAPGQRTNFTQKKGKPIAVSVELRGEQMWHFLSTFLTVVLPKIRDWQGVKARSGDRSGNFGIGVRPDVVGLWPEIAVNYDSYPAQMIPYLAIHLQTTAKTDRDGRILLSALGVPFISGGNR